MHTPRIIAGPLAIPPAVRRLYPFRSHYAEVEGLRMHYLDEGSGPAVVLVHGNPTWSFLYRSFVDPLVAAGLRVIAPDHIGFGLSDKLADPAAYTVEDHVRRLTALIRKLDLGLHALVVHDWGGPIGLAYAVRHPARVRRLVVFNTWAWRVPAGTRLRFPLGALRGPWLGTALVMRLNVFVNVLLPLGVHQRHRLTPAVMAGYRLPFAYWESRAGVLAFPRLVPLSPDSPSWELISEVDEGLASLQMPTLILWAERDPIFDDRVAQAWRRRLPHAEFESVPDAGHFLQEDAPEFLAARVAAFLRP